MRSSNNIVPGAFLGGEVEPGVFHGGKIEEGTFHRSDERPPVVDEVNAPRPAARMEGRVCGSDVPKSPPVPKTRGF